MQVSELIYKALVQARVIGETAKAAMSSQEAVALGYLNDIIDDINIDGNEIVLAVIENIVVPRGTSSYTMDGWLSFLNMQYALGNVNIQVALESNGIFYDKTYLSNVNALPFEGYARKTATGITLELYFPPNSDMKFTVNGFKRLTNVKLNDAIAVSDILYHNLMRFRLIQELRAHYQAPTMPRIATKIAQTKERLSKIKPIDNLVNCVSMKGISPETKAMQSVSDAMILGGFTP